MLNRFNNRRTIMTLAEEISEVHAIHIGVIERLRNLGLLGKISEELQIVGFGAIPENETLALLELAKANSTLSQLCGYIERKRLLSFMTPEVTAWWEENKNKVK